MGLGAVVRLFDDDVYRLRTALRQLGGGVIGSSLHPHVLENALRTADIVIVTDSRTALPLYCNPNMILKRNVLVFDLSDTPGKAFPTMSTIDLGELDGDACTAATGFSMVNDLNADTNRRRYCFVNPGSTVPRTAAMALSDTFITLLNSIADCDGSGATLPMTPGLQGSHTHLHGQAGERTGGSYGRDAVHRHKDYAGTQLKIFNDQWQNVNSMWCGKGENREYMRTGPTALSRLTTFPAPDTRLSTASLQPRRLSAGTPTMRHPSSRKLQPTTRQRAQQAQATQQPDNRQLFDVPEINPDAIAVDGACAGNPGMMEYRGVDVKSGIELFHFGPVPDGTNNVAEYLALVHALAYLYQKGDTTTPIYSDSRTARSWIRNRGCRTKLERTPRNAKIF